MTEAGLIAARFVHYATLAVAFGGFAYGAFAENGAPAAVGRHLRRLALWSSVGVVLAAAAVLFATVAGMGGSYAATLDSSIWFAIVWETDFGRVWTARLLLAVALAVIAAITFRRQLASLRWLGLMLAGGLLLTIALTGHAQIESGAAGVLHKTADAAHLVAAAAWIGALPPLLLLLRGTASGQHAERPYTAARQLQAFHTVGITAVLLLIGTGLINSWFLVGDPERLVTTRYGRLLLLKLVLFAAMVALAADNRFRLVPALSRKLRQGDGSRRELDQLRAHIQVELILAMLVLLVVAALGAIAPGNAS